ncbi:uncharacterized protein LOC115441446 [Manduca sexta]|uniref:Peptidase aspartic putative domain-containing protein n=1 Tax=Manduca sexta TaxID=7130 RepID=A0A922CHG9_MANSE|nr:uncharacterized protein LOC115441446 [Manduca sexta]KAG6446975.1 hypothetical protein O3G_MSEX004692 [Manduca sexta]
MENLSNLQFIINNTITKAQINFKKSPKERMTSSYIQNRLESLERSWTTFYENHIKIVSTYTASELKENRYITQNVFEITEELYIDYKTDLKETLINIGEHSSDEASKCQSKGNCLKLAKIQLPIFSGSYSSWINFRDLFISLVHNNKELDNVQKLHYLKTNLSGEPQNLLRSIPITNYNYEICWAKLKNRYDNKKYLTNSILTRFVSQRNILTESSSALKDLLDTSNQCLHDLRNLDINIENWDLIVIYMLSLKLDIETRKEWEALTSESINDLPTYKQFERFLEKKFRSLEFLNKETQQKVLNRNISVNYVTCFYCKEKHKLANCKQFVQLDSEERRKFVQANSLCFNCLGVNHTVYACRQFTRCRLCKRKHHTLLHFKNVPNPAGSHDDKNILENITPVPTISSVRKSTNVVSCFSNNHNQVLLPTALVSVDSRNGTAMVLRSLLDQGSQASFITESAVQLLGLRKEQSKNCISGLGGDPSASITCRSVVFVNIQSRVDPSFVLTVKAYVLKKLSSLLPDCKVKAQVLLNNSSMVLADPSFDIPNKIDLLLGAEVYSQILLEGIVKDQSGSLIAQNTKLGWVLSGQLINVNHSESNQKCHNVIVSLHTTQVSENELIKKSWEIETEPNYNCEFKQLTPEVQKCEDLFISSTKRDEFGRYIVRLPFRSDKRKCTNGYSYKEAYKRLISLEKRFKKNPEFKAQCSAVINEYLDLNHMKIVENGFSDKNNSVYLPHHAVVREDRITTKVRVVFDAFYGVNDGVSLNNELLVGPRLQPELRHIVIRWRCYSICLVADIVKIYRQVKVADEDRDFQRILWRGNPNEEIQHLRHLRVTFGVSSAPYLAVRSLQLSYDEGNEFPLAKHRVLSDFYMDDFMSGGQSVNEAVEINEQMSTMLKRGGFQLQKWMSNNNKLMNIIKKGSKVQENGLELKIDDVSKILGLMYTVRIPPLDTPVTKRKVISDISRLFDPLGWIASAITTAKVFIQKYRLPPDKWLYGTIVKKKTSGLGQFYAYSYLKM